MKNISISVALAPVIVGLDCISTAMGDQKDYVFSDSFRWVWFAIAVGWFLVFLDYIISELKS